MKAVIQRVTRASCEVEGKITGSIGQGLMILLGAAEGDTERECEKLADKIAKLRIFADSEGKTNLSVCDIDGGLLCISQFTLLADCHKGNRPSFIKAGPPDRAKELYERFMQLLSEKAARPVERGIFGADMKISLVNDGPFTIVLDCVDGEILR